MDNFNKDELEAPSWMSEEFFQNVLRKCENDDSVVVTKAKSSPATAKGDHYASIMFRFTVRYDTSKSKGNSKSLIVKTMAEVDGIKKEMFKESLFFETEIGMYNTTIPKFEAELRKIGDETVLGAKVLYYSLEPRKVIIFEDIVPKGYAMHEDRFLDIVEAKAALLKLAKWHAVSYKLGLEGDKSVTDYKDSFMNFKDVDQLPFMNGIEKLIEKIDTIDELKIYVPKLQSISKDLLKRCISSANSYRQPAAKGIFVLCHGDFHSKNMMFKRNDKDELEDVMLLDFQICFFGPAVMDVVYALYMVVNEDLRRYRREELMHYYASNFIETLKQLKFQGEYPKISDFYIEVFRHRHWEIFLLSTFLPIWFTIRDDVTMDLDDFMGSDEARKRVYDNESFIKELKRLLPIMLHTGYLE